MKKKKQSKNSRNQAGSNSKLFELVLSVFRESPAKKLNYKQLCKILKIKEMGVKIQMIEVMQEMEQSKILEQFQRGSYRLVEKINKIITKIKNTNNGGAYA